MEKVFDVWELEVEKIKDEWIYIDTISDYNALHCEKRRDEFHEVWIKVDDDLISKLKDYEKLKLRLKTLVVKNEEPKYYECYIINLWSIKEDENKICALKPSENVIIKKCPIEGDINDMERHTTQN